MECPDFDERCAPKLGPMRVENGMAQLMTHDIGAFTGIDGLALYGIAKKRELGAIVIRIQIDSFLQAHRQRGTNTRVPVIDAHGGPEVAAAPHGFGRGPITEFGSAY